MEEIEELYKEAGYAIDELIDDKQQYFAEMLELMILFTVKFGRKVNFLEFISCLTEYYSDIISELNREHDIFIAIRKFFFEPDDDEMEEIANDEELLEQVANIFDVIEQLVEIRIKAHVRNYNFYLDMLNKNGDLDTSYRVICHHSLITEPKKKELLSLLTRK